MAVRQASLNRDTHNLTRIFSYICDIYFRIFLFILISNGRVLDLKMADAPPPVVSKPCLPRRTEHSEERSSSSKEPSSFASRSEEHSSRYRWRIRARETVQDRRSKLHAALGATKMRVRLGAKKEKRKKRKRKKKKEKEEGKRREENQTTSEGNQSIITRASSNGSPLDKYFMIIQMITRWKPIKDLLYGGRLHSCH